LGKQTTSSLNGIEPELSGNRALLRPPSIVFVNHSSELLSLFIDLILKPIRPYPCHPFTSGEQAWQACIELRPDLVISDLRAYELSGLELCQRIRADSVLSGTPFLLFTPGLSILQLLSLKSQADYLSYPCSPSEFVRSVDNGLRQSRPEYMKQYKFR
jgi:DNA-binding response OmpR family regulator